MCALMRSSHDSFFSRNGYVIVCVESPSASTTAHRLITLARRTNYCTHLVPGIPSLTLWLSSLVALSSVSKAVVQHLKEGAAVG
jgi:hypothetical protein